jgi:thioredoxin
LPIEKAQLFFNFVFVRNKEFDRVLHKHATETGLPVIADFYSDGCGPCRMMAPIFLKVAKKHIETAVFVKVDTNQIYELSGRYGIRSLPTFLFFLDGKKVNQFSGKSFSPTSHSISTPRKHTGWQNYT